ncbi:MAG: NACHT domain-containing protein [Thioploca sp.]|nr:NACHT domain-containing protein [Thioploca sp.]
MMMLGPDGVGKTTLLATMYHQLSQTDNDSPFTLMATADTHQDLQAAYEKLSTIMTQPTFIPTGPLLKGTAGIIERQFQLLFNRKPELDLIFCDIAGGILRAEETNQDVIDFHNRLSQATVIINVIDGSALVEGDSNLANSKNEPQLIYELLSSRLQADKQPHLLLFVITKCEAWLRNAESQQQLEHAFEIQYEAMIELLAEMTHTVAVLIPVKTLGCVEFTHIGYQNQVKEMIFVRKPNLPFQPDNTDQPLRYALAFALQQHNQNRSKWNKLMRWLWNEDTAFHHALVQFAEERQKILKFMAMRL